MVATPGRRLGRYHLVEPIGAGPCGEVFRAKVVGVAGMERQLAIKRFYPEVLALPDAGARLQAASRSYGGLDHPRVARLSELGVAGGETFTATELVPGLDVGRLRAMAQDGGDTLPAGGVLQILSAAARAIGYAHGRGVCHWGVGPGNLIVTPDGDVKVTDFGILTCRLPARPSSDETLLARLPYLAPEQMLGEPLSAASDVFALGVLAYELVGGARPFAGATAAEIEQAIVSKRPAPLELPRPIARVIDRCLARSPFERFPDARSLADALDAALRLSPLTGARRDVGERVRVALEHLARINEQQLSGALSFTVPTPPPPGPPKPRPAANPALPLPPPEGSRPEIARPASDRVTPAPIKPRPFRVSSAPPITAPPPPAAAGDTDEVTRARPRLRVETDLSIGDDTGVRVEPLWPPTEPVPLVSAEGTPLADRVTLTGSPPPAPITRPVPDARAVAISQPPPFAAQRPAAPPAPAAPAPAPPPPPAPAPALASHAPPPIVPAPAGFGPPRRRRGPLYGAIAVLAIGGGAAAAYVLTRPEPAATAVDAGPVATGPVDGGGPVATATIDATGPAGATGPADARAAVPDATVAAATPDAATAVAVVDAGTVDAGAAPPDAAPAPAGDKLVITSTPSGAQVFLDGADQGTTPVTLPASTDEHSLALYLPGRELYLATIPGAGAHAAQLATVEPGPGKGGIKVRCKDKRRYYVFIDGKPTGTLCPNEERIPVALGAHTVETYDLTTEARRSFPVRVVKTERSTRVKVD